MRISKLTGIIKLCNLPFQNASAITHTELCDY